MNYIKLITFIPWIIYFLEIMYYRIGILEKNDLEKKKYFHHLNKNFFTSINMKEILLFVIFMIFIQYENTTVLEILFSAMYVYLIIDFFHTLRADCKKIEHKSLLIESIIIVGGLITFFILKNHLYTTYILMFAVSILSTFIIYLLSLPIVLSKKKKTK